MYFSKETLATNSRLGGHWSELWANRNMWNLQNDSIIAANRAMMTPDMLACNAVGGFSRDFWAEIDNRAAAAGSGSWHGNRKRPDRRSDRAAGW